MLTENKWVSRARRMAGAATLLVGIITLLSIFRPWAHPYQLGPLAVELSFWSFMTLAALSSTAMVFDKRNLPFNILTFLAWFFFILISAVSYPRAETPPKLEWGPAIQALVIFLLWPMIVTIDSMFCTWDRKTAIPERQEKQRLMQKYILNENQAEQVRVLMLTTPNNWTEEFQQAALEEAKFLFHPNSIEALFASVVRRKKGVEA